MQRMVQNLCTAEWTAEVPASGGLYGTIQLSCYLTGTFHLKNSFCGCSTEQGSDVPTRHGANIWIVFWTHKIRLAWETAWVEQKKPLIIHLNEMMRPQRCSLQYDGIICLCTVTSDRTCHTCAVISGINNPLHSWAEEYKLFTLFVHNKTSLTFGKMAPMRLLKQPLHW